MRHGCVQVPGCVEGHPWYYDCVLLSGLRDDCVTDAVASQGQPGCCLLSRVGGDCVTAAAACMGQSECSLLSGVHEDRVTAATASLGPYDCVLLSGLRDDGGTAAAASQGQAECCLLSGVGDDCVTGAAVFIGAAWLSSVVGTVCRLRYSCCCLHGPALVLSFVWRARRLRDCCCCLIGALWLPSVVDCMTVAAASLGPYDCELLSGLWPTAWLLLLPHWGRMTAFCCHDYGRLRDCCCCLIGAVWLRSVVGTMGDCVTAAAAPLGLYDCVLLSGLWLTAWLLLLPHWGRMTASCCQDYGRLRDCCCCFIGTVWLRSVVGTMGDCVTAAAVYLGQPQYRLLPRVRVFCCCLQQPACCLLSGVCEDCVTGAAAHHKAGVLSVVCTVCLLLLWRRGCLYLLFSLMCRRCSARLATTAWLMLLTPALRPIASICSIANAGTA